MIRIPWQPALLVFLAVILVVGGCGDDPGRLSEMARANWSAGRLDQAEANLARLATLRPLTLAERLLRAQIARDRGRFDDAIAALGEPLPGESPGEAALLASTRGTLELLRGRFRVAESSFQRALALDPARAEARRELINLFSLQGRNTELNAQFQELARSDSLPGVAPLGFADLYLWTLGRREDSGPAEIADALERAVRADPGDRASLLGLGENLRRLGRLDEAVTTLGQLPASDPEARVIRARIALDQGDPDQAMTLIDQTAGAASARLRGRLALSRGDASTAVREFREASRDEPHDRDTLFGLGQALRLAGDSDSARPFTQAAVDRDQLEWLVQNARPPGRRDDPAIQGAIGEAALALGRRDLARAWLRLALRGNPLDASLQKTLHRIDTAVGRPRSGQGDASR